MKLKTKRLLSKAARKQWADKRQRKKKLLGIHRAWSDPKVLANKKLVCNTNSFKLKMSEMSTARWADKVESTKMVKATRKAMKKLWTPEYRKLHSDRVALRWTNSEYHDRVVKATLDGLGKRLNPNKAEFKLYKIIKENFPNDFKMNIKGKVIIGGKIPDFVNVNGKKLVVEMFGDYWHGVEKTGRPYFEEEERRRKAFAKYGFKTVIIWEHELDYPNYVCFKIRNWNT